LAFCEERAKAGVLPSALKDRVVNLMDKLAGVSEKKITVVEFEEDGKTTKNVEYALVDELKNFLSLQPSFVTFGEQYRKLTAKGDPKALLGDPEQTEAMRAEMGLDKEEKKK
jgi:hypothetical protein